MKLEVVDGGVEIKIEESSSLLFVEGGRCPLFKRRTFINVSTVYRDKLAEEKVCRGGVRSLTYRSVATARSYARCIHTLHSAFHLPLPIPVSNIHRLSPSYNLQIARCKSQTTQGNKLTCLSRTAFNRTIHSFFRTEIQTHIAPRRYSEMGHRVGKFPRRVRYAFPALASNFKACRG